MLKNLFIPHSGNNYQPHALHPHRLLFHGISAIIIKVFITLAILALPASAWLTPDVLTAESQKIIKLTNVLRLKVGVSQLKENSLLNQAAFDKVQDMMVNQYFAHLSLQNKNMLDWLKSVNYSYAAAGENLAMGFSSADDVFTAWTKSKTHYANLIDPDFKEIGVAMDSGKFNNFDTTMVAQYFATPKVSEQPVVAMPLVNIATSTQPTKQAATTKPVIRAKPKTVVKGEKFIEPAIAVDLTPPQVDLAKTKIWVSDSSLSGDKIVRVEAYLSPDTQKAQANFNKIVINLSQDLNEPGKWTGSAVISKNESENIFSPVVMATLTATDLAGNTSTTDINWQNFEQIKPSLVKQYLFLKNVPSQQIQYLMTVGKLYFTILLAIGIIALLLNIFIEFKKQHPHIIALTLVLLCILAFLLII